jgi:predicted RND superfamily exporter protein
MTSLARVGASETTTAEQLISPDQLVEVRRLRDIFGANSELLLVSWSDATQLSPKRIAEIESVIVDTPGVAHAWSPLSRPRLELRGQELEVQLAQGPPTGSNKRDNSATAGLNALLRPSPRQAQFLVTVDASASTLTGARGILTDLRSRLDVARSASERVSIVGLLAHRVQSWEQARADTRAVLPLLVLAALLVPWLLFGTFWAGLLPLVLGATSTAGTLLLYRYFVGDVQPWVLLLIPLSWTVATMDTLHLYECSARRRQTGEPDAVRGAMRELALPCGVTAAITAVSLLSLALPGGPPLLSTFGIWGAVGVVVAYVVSLLAGPALLRITRDRVGAPELPNRLARMLIAGCQRRAPAWIGLWLALLFVAVAALPSLKMESSYQRPFVPEHPFAHELESVRELSGTDLLPIEIYIEPKSQESHDPAKLLLATISLEQYLRTLPETQVVLSAATLAVELLEHDPRARQVTARLQRDRREAARIAELVHDVRLGPWVDSKLEVTRTVWLLRDADSERVQELQAWVENFATKLLTQHEVSVSGPKLIMQRAESDGQRAVAWGMAGDLLLLLLVLMVLFRRAHLVVAGFFGNLLPVVLLGALMVAAGIPWTLGLLGLPVLVLGLAADDTVHLLWKARDCSLPTSTALSRAHRRHGSAAIGTSLLISASLMTLSVSGLTASRQLGLLLPAGILLALAAELTLVPALLRLGHILKVQRRRSTGPTS